MTNESATKIVAACIAGMVNEAAFRGVACTAADIIETVKIDPNGETSTYLRQSICDAVDLFQSLQREPELFSVLGRAA